VFWTGSSMQPVAAISFISAALLFIRRCPAERSQGKSEAGSGEAGTDDGDYFSSCLTASLVQ
jgi:hypothetical protein